MGRLIDANALFDQLVCYQRKLHDADRELTANQCIAFVENASTVDAVPREELNKLAKKVSDMRDVQKRYFKGRSINDLTVSKQLEAEVDTIVKEILNPSLTLFYRMGE